MKNATKVLALLLATLLISSCAANLSPAQRYAREHSGREFKSWEDESKKAKKAKNRKVKDSNKVPHTWK